ncbi:DUF4097 family beta strand repeat-containing protein [Salibacterium halotolerans]|uniref:DUF4097 and DUF4098 domain-containing protein YvlB n=1 Tax=Salibacterium halotolerans TaxID=1884432 RepID=A0A1I5VSI8_9BACI|nr:DUF4097 domain-containing protein [Salibacterium halotolerans]SFQ10421.1 DUF4097 and DUF4098 domain-containing protein YvlB [Salibacterium halotolerans]
MEEERKLILKMVEDGKISPEDGSKLLKAVNDGDGEKQTEESNQSVSGPDTGASRKEEEKTGPSTETSLPTRVSGRQESRSDWNTDREQEKQEDHRSGAATGFYDFIDSAVRKIKELDLDFNFGPYQEVHHIFQHKNIEQPSLDISLENGSLEWRPWDEADVKLECDVKVYKSRTQEEARQEFLKETVFEVDDTHLRFYTRTKTMKVDAVLYVPRRTYESLNLYTFNGHLRGKEVKVNSLSAKAVNGSLTIEQPDTMKCHLETVNGPVKVTGGRIDVGDVKTMNGTIELNADIRDLEAESVNGTIDALMRVSQDARAALSATTGSIFVTVPPEIRTEGHLRTNVGNYNYSLRDMDIHEEKKDFIQKSLRFTSNTEASPRLRLNAQTKTGSISVKPEDS